MKLLQLLFWQLFIVGCCLSGVIHTACPNNTVTVDKWLSTSGYTLGEAMVPLLGKTAFTGTILVPTNKALNETLEYTLEVASNITGNKVTSLPAGMDLPTILALPAFQDVLRFHIIPSSLLDPAQLGPANFTQGIFALTGIETLLTSQATDAFCPKSPPATALLDAFLNGTSGSNIQTAIVVAPGDYATIFNLTVPGICPTAVVHIIDDILIPCRLEDSVMQTFAEALAPPPAKSPAAKSPAAKSPAPSTASPSPAVAPPVPRGAAGAAGAGMRLVAGLGLAALGLMMW